MWLWKFLVRPQVFTRMWNVKPTKPLPYTNTIFPLFMTLLFLIYPTYSYLIFPHWIRLQKYYNCFLNYHLKSYVLATPQSTKHVDSVILFSKQFKLNQKPNVSNQITKQLFKCFLIVNTFFSKRYLTPHASFRQFYFYNHHNNIGVWSLSKLFTSWQETLFLIQNIMNFKIKYFVFTSSYFRYESLALNWKSITLLKNLWRYTTPFIFFLNNKTTSANDNYFARLKTSDVHLFFIVDPIYHTKTLHYCWKYKFLTVGPVSIAANFYTLNYPIPVATNSVFSNLFFLRLLFKLEVLSSETNFLILKHTK